MTRPLLVLACFVLAAPTCEAAVLREATLGCRQPADAAKAAAGTDVAALRASRACIPFAKGIAVDVDEDKPPLSCTRLKGDLGCWWVTDHAVDEFPGGTPDKPANRQKRKS